VTFSTTQQLLQRASLPIAPTAYA